MEYSWDNVSKRKIELYKSIINQLILMSTIAKIVENSGILLLGRVATKAISFLILLYIANYLGPDDFGKFSFAFAFIYFFGFIPELGIHDILVREAAKDPTKTGKLIANATAVKIVLSVIAFLLSFIVINLLDYTSLTKKALYIASISLLVTCLSAFGVVYEINFKMRYSVFFGIFSRIVFLLIVLVSIFKNSGLLILVFASVAADCTHNILMVAFSKKIVKLDFNLDLDLIKKLLYESLPVALASVFIMIYFRIDVLMLSFLKNDIDVGFYSAAYRLTEAFTFFPSALITSIFPLMSKYNHASPEMFKKVYKYSFKYLFVSGILMGLIVTFFAERIIRSIYGPDYQESIVALQILVWATAIMFVNSLLCSTYISSGCQNVIAKISAFAAIFNILLNYILIPPFSYVGAALATVATEFLVMIFGLYWIYKNVLYDLMFAEIFYPLVGALSTVGVFTLIHGRINLSLFYFLLPITFISALYLTGWFDENDKKMLKKFFIRKK